MELVSEMISVIVFVPEKIVFVRPNPIQQRKVSNMDLQGIKTETSWLVVRQTDHFTKEAVNCLNNSRIIETSLSLEMYVQLWNSRAEKGLKFLVRKQ